MSMNDDEYLRHLRIALDAAESDLCEAVAVKCPAGPDEHAPVQHRDRQPPWCNSCGRDARGTLRRSA
jgi:hypothetical protein